MLGLTFAQLESIGFRFVLDALAPSSAYGEHSVRRLAPFGRGERAALERELDNIDSMVRALPRIADCIDRLERLLMQVRDIRASISRCGNPELSEVELFEIKRYLLQLKEIAPVFAQISAQTPLSGIEFHELSAAFELLDPEKSGIASFHISERYSPELTMARREKREIEAEIHSAQLRAMDSADLHEKRREIVVREQNAESAVREYLSRELEPFAQKMLENTHAIAKLDLTVRKAKLALKYGGTRPEITENELHFLDMTNPKSARELEMRGSALKPVSLSLSSGTAVITGANMGGKSMVLRTLTLNALLVQCGFFSFASSAKACLFESVHMLSDELEDSARGLSSFGGEVTGLLGILKAAEEGFALIVLDEFARGTNPSEGAAIACAVAEKLNRLRSISVMATHYDGVPRHASAHFQVIGLENVDFAALNETINASAPEKRVEIISNLMDYGLKRVHSNSETPRDALNICRLLGLDAQILQNAEHILKQKSY